MKSVSLSEVAEINPKWDKGLSLEEPVSFVGMADLSDARGAVVNETKRRVREVRKGYTPFRRDDLLVAKITPCFENGKIGIASISEARGAGSTEFHVVRPGPELDKKYALHYLRRPQFRAAGELRMTGSGGQRRVPLEYVSDAKIPLPSLGDQRRIADILDKVDALRAKRRESIAHLDSLGQSIFQEMFGSPSTNARGWEVRRLGEMLVSAQYGTSEKSVSAGTVPVLRMGNLTYDGELDFSDLKYLAPESVDLKKYRLMPGDVLFNRTNSAELVGKTAMFSEKGDYTFAGYLIRLRCGPDLNPAYLSAFMNTADTKTKLRSMCKSIVGMANINAKEVQTIDVMLPPLVLQQEFADRLEVVARLRDRYRAQLVELTDLFLSLQDRAFKGEL